MFYEYALDPQLLTNWKDFRYHTEKYSWFHGRLIARYPKGWKKLVYESLSHCGEVERKMIEVKLELLDNHRMIKRPSSSYDPKKTWLNNTFEEHERKAFHAVITRENPDKHPDVLLGDFLDETDPRFQVPNKICERKADEFAEALTLLLKSSKRILFIDPNFSPEKWRFRTVLETFIRVADNNRREQEPKLELHTSIERYFKGYDREAVDEINKAKLVMSQFNQNLPDIIPLRKSITIFIWKEIKDESAECRRDKFHNRYVLTDLGGVSFGTGLDQSDQGMTETDDLLRLDENIYKFRWEQYASANPAFDLVIKPVEIKGSNIEKYR
jgi:hypothetical protein